MNKAEALRVSVFFIETYDELKDHFEVTRTITLVYGYMPDIEGVERLANYILENEDLPLYDKTFGVVDFSFVGKILNRLNKEYWEIEENIRAEYTNKNYEALRECGKFDEINNLVKTYEYWYKVREANDIIKAVFKNLIHQSVSDTTTVNEAHREGWKLPRELATDKALKIWDRAKQNGLIDDNFKWLKGLQMLACFAREMSLQLDLGKGINKDGSKRINWRIFEMIFELKKGTLRGSLNDIRKIEKLPHEFDILNGIFGEVSNPLI